MKTVSVYFANHFDLTWRRCWARDYVYQGSRYASYQRIEELCLEHNLALAEHGNGAYVVEQGLTLRAFLGKHPDALPRMQALFAKGLFEICGSGEAIIDINLCSFETMCRNLASGLHYCRKELGMPPMLACHDDGFGSSAQFPQVIRLCGLPGIQGLSYSLPDNTYWRGLDGSTILVWKGAPGQNYFFDHCYHEPCRTCHGTPNGHCDACGETGLDLPQNFYPPFDPVSPDDFNNGQAQYVVKSEEMLPPTNFSTLLRTWEAQQTAIRYRWATPRSLAPQWQPLAEVTEPPSNQIASRVENNPVQTGSYVTRIRIKQQARRCEALQYAWETALVLTSPNVVNHAAWSTSFLELPLFFFHDAVTGTHQDEAFTELIDRMSTMRHQVNLEAERTLHQAGFPTACIPAPATAGSTLLAFSPCLGNHPLRVALSDGPWQAAEPLVAVSPGGQRHPVVYAWHRWSPPSPVPAGRWITAVGSAARTRPDRTMVHIEMPEMAPLEWQTMRLEAARVPAPLQGQELRNNHLAVELGEHGISTIRDLITGTTAYADKLAALGGLVIEDDTGDPWTTRRPPSFCKSLTPFTRRQGALKFEGYSEAYYAGCYEPNLRFGREEDPALFALEWSLTIRLLDNARRVDFEYEIFWKSENRRIRAVFPVQADSDTAWYSIPGGVLERPRHDQKETFLWSHNGDWPGLHFVAARPAAGQASGWAVVNQGTPASRVADGRILISLLRSPGFGHCLERYAQDYPMPTNGIRDHGWHHFSLSFTPHAGVADMGRLALDAAALNSTVPVATVPPDTQCPSVPIHISGEGLHFMTAKLPFGGGQDVIIRIVNLQAKPAKGTLRRRDGQPLTLIPCLLTEENAGAPLTGNPLTIVFRPFETRSFRMPDGFTTHL